MKTKIGLTILSTLAAIALIAQNQTSLPRMVVVQNLNTNQVQAVLNDVGLTNYPVAQVRTIHLGIMQDGSYFARVSEK